jgi:hypothetical protein
MKSAPRRQTLEYSPRVPPQHSELVITLLTSQATKSPPHTGNASPLSSKLTSKQNASRSTETRKPQTQSLSLHRPFHNRNRVQQNPILALFTTRRRGPSASSIIPRHGGAVRPLRPLPIRRWCKWDAAVVAH